jgi:hypothetical protein
VKILQQDSLSPLLLPLALPQKKTKKHQGKRGSCLSTLSVFLLPKQSRSGRGGWSLARPPASILSGHRLPCAVHSTPIRHPRLFIPLPAHPPCHPLISHHKQKQQRSSSTSKTTPPFACDHVGLLRRQVRVRLQLLMRQRMQRVIIDNLTSC